MVSDQESVQIFVFVDGDLKTILPTKFSRQKSRIARITDSDKRLGANFYYLATKFMFKAALCVACSLGQS